MCRKKFKLDVAVSSWNQTIVIVSPRFLWMRDHCVHLKIFHHKIDQR